MKCKHSTIRTLKGTKYYFCRFYKCQLQLNLEQCKKCPKFEFKEYKPIKKKTNKLAKIEKHRFSILTDDLEHCYICTEREMKNIFKEDIHEVYGGRNRKISMKNGLAVPLCRKCHNDYEIQKYLKRLVQITYEETHTREEFISLIGKSYL